jgi:methyl-accepting chemotaxis protein
VGKKTRTNYLIDKPFQLGFIIKYVIIILLVVVVTFSVALLYYFQDSLLGTKRFDSSITYNVRGLRTFEGKQIYNYGIPKQIPEPVFENDILTKVTKVQDAETLKNNYSKSDGIYSYIQTADDSVKSKVWNALYSVGYVKKMKVFEDVDENNQVVYKFYQSLGPESREFQTGDILTQIDTSALEPDIGPIKKITTRFHIIVVPLVLSNIALIVIITIYSLFFSHKMAGPIYRIRISLDRMLTGDLDFKIRVRKNDFFQNIVERMERLRLMVKNDDFKSTKKDT